MDLRLAAGSDARGIVEIYGPIVASTPISFETEPPSEEEMARRIREITVSYPWLVCEEGGRVAGYAYGSRHRARAAYEWSVEVSAYVHPDFRRRGIGKALYQSLFEILRVQGYYNAYAGITLPNAGSVGLHESFGFRPVGIYRKIGFKLGAWHDVGWWELALQTVSGDPRTPVSLGEIRQDPAWGQITGAGCKLVR